MPGAWVQDDTNEDDSGASGTTIAKAFGSNVTAANLIAVWGGWGTIDTTVTCADTQSNSYTQKTKTWDDTNGQGHVQFYAANITGGANTVTITFGDSVTYRRIGVMEISGLQTASPDDGGALQVQAGGTTTDYYSSGNITTTVTDFCFGSWQDIGGSGATLTAGATPAFTLRQLNTSNIGAMETLASQAAATFDANFTASIGNRAFTGIMAFKEAAGGRTTKNTRAFPLGMDIGAGMWVHG